MSFMALVISVALGGLGVWIVSRVISDFTLRGGFLSAMVIGGVYGLLKFFLAGALTMLSLPLVVLTLGLFIVVINAFLLWVTDKLLARLEIRSAGALFMSAILLSVIDFVFGALIGYSAPY